MKTKDLIRLGVPVGEPIKLAHEFIQSFISQGNDGALLEGEIFNVVANPPAFFADQLRAPLARAIYRPAFTQRAELPLRRLRSDRSTIGREALPRSAFAPWRQWGEGPRRRKGIEGDGRWAREADAVKQMANACALPSRPSTSPRDAPPPPRRWARPSTDPRYSLPTHRQARSCPMRFLAHYRPPLFPSSTSVGYGLPIGGVLAMENSVIAAPAAMRRALRA